MPIVKRFNVTDLVQKNVKVATEIKHIYPKTDKYT